MKKIWVCVLLVCTVAALVLACGKAGGEETPREAYLRIHIRANSNGADDQAVKYEVKEAIVEFLMPVAASADDKEEAIALLRARLPEIEEVADGVLVENGFSYTARASVREEEFPTRVYEGVTLEAGVYDALIVELGTGKGDNWWCVIYPPLCFSGEATGNNVQYRSRIWEIIRNFFSD